MALGVNVVQLNLYLKRLIDRVSKTHILVEIDALFRASEEVEPSHIGTLFDFFITNTFLHHEYFLHHGYVLVPGVGLVFEFYYYLAATRKDRKQFQKHADEKTKVGHDEKTKILQRYALPFAFFVASMAVSRSQGRNNKPMFYLSLIDDYHGLSNRGAQVRSLYNTGLAKKPYNKLKDSALSDYNDKTQDALSKGLAVGLADNYNQQYWVSRVDATQQGLQNSNRCVGAVSLIRQDVKLNPEANKNLNSIPPTHELLTHLHEALCQVEDALESSVTENTEPSDWKFFDDAEVTRQNVHCVPLKMHDEEIKNRQLPPHDIGLTHFRPLWVLPVDPASNKGCYQMFQKLYAAFETTYNNGHYIAFRFDMNIYNMFLRVTTSPQEMR